MSYRRIIFRNWSFELSYTRGHSHKEKMRKVVSFSLPEKEQMVRLIDAVCRPDGKSKYLEWSVNDETGELDLYEGDYE